MAVALAALIVAGVLGRWPQQLGLAAYLRCEFGGLFGAGARTCELPGETLGSPTPLLAQTLRLARPDVESQRLSSCAEPLCDCIQATWPALPDYGVRQLTYDLLIAGKRPAATATTDIRACVQWLPDSGFTSDAARYYREGSNEAAALVALEMAHWADENWVNLRFRGLVAMEVAREYRARGDNALAAAAYQRAVDTFSTVDLPESAVNIGNSLATLGDIAAEQGDLALAAAYYQDALAVFEAEATTTELDARTAQLRRQIAAMYLSLASIASDSGADTDAFALRRQALLIDPLAVDRATINVWVAALAASDSPADALSTLLFDDGGGDARLAYRLALALKDNRQPALARHLLSEARARNATDGGALWQAVSGFVLFAEGDTASAAATLDSAITMIEGEDRGLADTWRLEQSLAYEIEGNYPRAIAVLLLASETFGERYWYWQQLARVYTASGQTDLATGAIDEAVRLAPPDVQITVP